MNGQKPEALRLAEYLFESAQFHPQLSEDEQGGYASEFDMVLDEAAAELRRLHEVNAELVDALRNILWHRKPGGNPSAYQREIEIMAGLAIDKATGEQQ